MIKKIPLIIPLSIFILSLSNIPDVSAQTITSEIEATRQSQVDSPASSLELSEDLESSNISSNLETLNSPDNSELPTTIETAIEEENNIITPDIDYYTENTSTQAPKIEDTYTNNLVLLVDNKEVQDTSNEIQTDYSQIKDNTLSTEIMENDIKPIVEATQVLASSITAESSQIVNNVNTNQKVLSLTFDDADNDDNLTDILDTLLEQLSLSMALLYLPQCNGL